MERDKPLTREEVDVKLNMLRNAVEEEKDKVSSSRIIEVMKEVIPTYVDPNELNSKAEKALEMKMADN